MSDELLLLLWDAEVEASPTSDSSSTFSDSSSFLDSAANMSPMTEEDDLPSPIETEYVSPQPISTRSSSRDGLRLSTRLPHSIAGSPSLLHLNDQQIFATLQHIKKSSRRWMSAGTRPTGDASLADLLCQKERDLELAAKIGQSLLEHNKELQARNEFLEENLSTSSETVIQLRHELHKRIDLLRVYSHLDDDGFPRENSDDSLKNRLERLHSENVQLKAESSTLRSMADAYADKERHHVQELSRQLEMANEKINHLQSSIVEKNTECASQTSLVERLLKEIASKNGREKELCSENEELNKTLEEAVYKQEILSTEMNELQERYADLRSMFCEAEEELVRFRQQPSPFRTSSVDSLYDSLASELENSDSGFSGTPAVSARGDVNLRLELERVVNKPSSAEEVDVPSVVLAEVARKRIAIEPTTPPHTPMSENTTTPVEETKETPKEQRRRITCDASTSTCVELAKEADVSGVDLQASPLATSTPKSDGGDSRMEKGGLLQFSEPHTTECSPSTPIRQCDFSALSTPAIVSHPAPLSKTSSEDSLDGYVAPKLGEPGIPGTRDLDFSLKQLKARRQNRSERWRSLTACLPSPPTRTTTTLSLASRIPTAATVTAAASISVSPLVHVLRRDLLTRIKVEKAYAQFRRKKGLPPSTFFQEEQKKTSVKRISSVDKSWTDYSVIMGQDHQRLALTNRSMSITAGLGTKSQGQGVVTRAELSSPTSSPHRQPIFPSGLAALLPSMTSTASLFPSGGIVMRRGL